MNLFDVSIGDKVVLNGKFHENKALLDLFRIAKEKYNQDYLYVVNIRNFLVECSLNPAQCGIFAKPDKLCIYGEPFDFSKPRQEFECGTRINIPEINCFNVIYLTTIGDTRLIVERGDEENFLNGYIFATESIEAGRKISIFKKLVSLSKINERANKFDKNFLEELLKDNCLLNENETLQF